MVKQGFSLLEMIFIILIISVIVTIALPKLQSNSQKTSFIHLKNNLLLIQNGINEKIYENYALKSNREVLSLDEDEIYLFSNILKIPFIGKNESNHWQKIEEDVYRYHLNNKESIDFTFDREEHLFLCDKTNDLCRKVLL